MLGGISGVSPYSTYYMNPYRTMNRSITPAQGTTSPAEQMQKAQNAQRTNGTVNRWTVRPSNPEAPVQPVDAVKRVDPDAQKANAVLSIREGADPAEMAVRMRITPYQDEENAEELGIFAGEEEPEELGIFAGKEEPEELGIFADEEEPAELGVFADKEEPAELGILPGKEDEDENLGVLAKDEDEDNAQGVEDTQEAAEDGKCQTCEKRKYQDGSDDMSVSFQSPTNIKPGQVAAAVRGHEMEHVIHEQAKAKQEGRKVVSQSVTMHTAICPECGTVYISGGETRTVTKANPELSQEEREEEKGQEPLRKSFSVIR